MRFDMTADPINFPDELLEASPFLDGAQKTVMVNVYERDTNARTARLQRWGMRCTVCSFDFKATYGERGDGYIHVHHLRPLSEIGAAYELDLVRDLRPVCPNCHAMLHRRIRALDIEALQEILRQERMHLAQPKLVTTHPDIQ